jgi:16S rRNA (guanine527-N7)-methyltransferase
MKLFRSDLQMVLLDSARKRTDYMNELLRATGIDCEVVNGRSEELAHDLSFRGGYGLVTARALANLSALCEYCLPFVEVGGVFLAMKGHQVNDELASASNAIRVLGGEVERVHEYTLPGGDGRSLVVIRKMSQTPVKYPRRRINITKNPIV